MSFFLEHIVFGRKKKFSRLLDLGKFLPIDLAKAPLALVTEENLGFENYC